MKLFILEGCHGSGKSTLLSQLKDVEILEENFINLDISPKIRSLVWLSNWVQSVIAKKKNGCKILITDRGPISSFVYEDFVEYKLLERIVETLKDEEIQIFNLYIPHPSIKEHRERLIKRNGPYVEIEIKNLEIVRAMYEYVCKEQIRVFTVDDIYECINNF